MSNTQPPLIHPSYAPLIQGILEQVSKDLSEVTNLLKVLADNKAQDPSSVATVLNLSQRLIDEAAGQIDDLTEDLQRVKPAPVPAKAPATPSANPDLLDIHSQAVCIEGLFEAMDALRGTLGPSALAVDALIVSGLPRAKQLSRELEGATENLQA